MHSTAHKVKQKSMFYKKINYLKKVVFFVDKFFVCANIKNMKTNKEQNMTPETKNQIRTFEDYSSAWAFMKEADSLGLIAGYPTLKAPYAVEFIEKTNKGEKK